MQLKKDMVFLHKELHTEVLVEKGTSVQVRKIGKEAYLLVAKRKRLNGQEYLAVKYVKEV
jgi:hypothetical protein